MLLTHFTTAEGSLVWRLNQDECITEISDAGAPGADRSECVGLTGQGTVTLMILFAMVLSVLLAVASLIGAGYLYRVQVQRARSNMLDDHKFSVLSEGDTQVRARSLLRYRCHQFALICLPRTRSGPSLRSTVFSASFARTQVCSSTLRCCCQTWTRRTAVLTT